MTDAPRVDVLTFGCRLNIVESEAMRRHALRAGHHDLTIVNTCAVTAEAVRQARQAVRRVRRQHPRGRVVVTGCASEIDPAGFAAPADVDAVLPNAVKATAAAWVRGSSTATTLPPTPTDFAPAAAGGHTRGFVEIQNGCDHRCTFCIIPFGRGASRSVPIDDVVERVRDLVARGTREVVLTGVDITSYGRDAGEDVPLGALVRCILREVPDLARLRLSSLDCIETDPDLLDALATEPRLMPHLHLSLQSGSDLILKRMKRRHSRRDSVAFCVDLRRHRPEMVFGADLIAGFPTETDAEFAETLALLDDCGLTHVHVFPYSVRPGTPAARMPQVPGRLIHDRARHLRAAAEVRLARHLDAQVGRRLEVLTERDGVARAADFTRVRLRTMAAPGLLQPAVISGHDGRALLEGAAAAC